MLKLGEKIISDIYLGDKKIAKVFLGDKLVYQANKPIFLDYIIFDGNSYIDTGIQYQTCTIKTETKFYPTSTRQLMGFSGASSIHYWGCSESGVLEPLTSVNGLEFNEIEIAYNKDDVDNKTLTMTADGKNVVKTGKADTTKSYLIGCLDTSSYFAQCEVKYNKIYANDKLIQDLRPCIDPKGVVCFYDMVTKKYFYNQGTGTLTAGNVIKFVDYIITDGSSYIDTEYCPNENTYIEYTFEVTQNPTATYNGLFGSRVNTSVEEYHVFLQSGLFLRLDFGRYAEPNVNYKTALNTKYTIKAGIGEIYINDELVKSYTPKTGQAKNSMYLGNFNNNGTPYTNGTAQRIYPCSIYENGVLVRDLKPCVVAGEAGFYDMVTGKVFTNAGTGTLKASGRFVTSILFDGASFIDTGIAHQTCDIECDIRFEETGTRQLMGFGAGTGQYWGAGATGIFDYMNGTNALDRTLVVLNVDITDITITVNADGVTRKSTKGSQVTQLKYRIGGAPTGVSSTSYWCTCEVWSNKFKVDGVVIQDLRPYVDENGEACFKDVVTGNLLYNQGTGTLGYTE